MHRSEWLIQIEFSSIFGGSLSHYVVSVFFFNLTDPLHVFYGSWLCVFMRFLCVQAYMSLHLFMYFLSFLVHFLLLAFLVLLWFVLFCLLLRSLFFLRGGKKWYGSKGKWRWEWLGRVRGGGNCNQNTLHEKVYFQ